VLDFRRQDRARIDVQSVETPLELARTPAHWMDLFGSSLPLPETRVRPFTSTEIAPGVRFYTAGLNARTLIVGFSGKKYRLMLPIAAILQHLDESQFDLLLLADNRQSHFAYGIGRYATSFYHLCERIAAFKQQRGYDHLIAYGTSMGALPALRAGNLTGADRSIGVGVRYAWDVPRILRGNVPPAFDPICHCRQTGTVQALVFHGTDVEADELDARKLAAIMPGCRMIPLPWSMHNPLFKIFRSSRLEDFQRAIFNLDIMPDNRILQSVIG
jgi:hypothetical protein